MLLHRTHKFMETRKLEMKCWVSTLRCLLKDNLEFINTEKWENCVSLH